LGIRPAPREKNLRPPRRGVWGRSTAGGRKRFLADFGNPRLAVSRGRSLEGRTAGQAPGVWGGAGAAGCPECGTQVGWARFDYHGFSFACRPVGGRRQSVFVAGAGRLAGSFFCWKPGNRGDSSGSRRARFGDWAPGSAGRSRGPRPGATVGFAGRGGGNLTERENKNGRPLLGRWGPAGRLLPGFCLAGAPAHTDRCRNPPISPEQQRGGGGGGGTDCAGDAVGPRGEAYIGRPPAPGTEGFPATTVFQPLPRTRSPTEFPSDGGKGGNF